MPSAVALPGGNNVRMYLQINIMVWKQYKVRFDKELLEYVQRKVDFSSSSSPQRTLPLRLHLCNTIW